MPAFKKNVSKNYYPAALSLLSLCFRDSKITLLHRNTVLPPKKVLVWHWCCLSQCNVIEKNHLLILHAFSFISNSVEG